MAPRPFGGAWYGRASYYQGGLNGAQPGIPLRGQERDRVAGAVRGARRRELRRERRIQGIHTAVQGVRRRKPRGRTENGPQALRPGQENDRVEPEGAGRRERR